MKSEGQKQSQQHEKRLATKFGGKVTPASGAFWSQKGDVKTPTMLIEHKFTGNKFFTLTSAVLEKIFAEAVLTDRMPVLGISMNSKNYIVLSEDDFYEMMTE